MARLRTPVALIATLLLWPAAALAQSSGTPLIQPPGGPSNPLSPFSNQGPVPTTTTTTPTVTTTSTSGGGLSGGGAVAIGVGALVVLGGISFFIWYDARKRAPVRRRAATAAAGGGQGPRQRPQKPRKLSPAERKRRKRGRAR